MKNLSKQNKKDLSIKIKTVDSVRSEHLLRLMLEYYKTNVSISFNEGDIINSFSLKVVKDIDMPELSAITIDLDILPRDLQWILYRYISL